MNHRRYGVKGILLVAVMMFCLCVLTSCKNKEISNEAAVDGLFDESVLGLPLGVDEEFLGWWCHDGSIYAAGFETDSDTVNIYEYSDGSESGFVKADISSGYAQALFKVLDYTGNEIREWADRDNAGKGCLFLKTGNVPYFSLEGDNSAFILKSNGLFEEAVVTASQYGTIKNVNAIENGYILVYYSDRGYMMCMDWDNDIMLWDNRMLYSEDKYINGNNLYTIAPGQNYLSVIDCEKGFESRMYLSMEGRINEQVCVDEDENIYLLDGSGLKFRHKDGSLWELVVEAESLAVGSKDVTVYDMYVWDDTIFILIQDDMGYKVIRYEF